MAAFASAMAELVEFVSAELQIARVALPERISSGTHAFWYRGDGPEAD